MKKVYIAGPLFNIHEKRYLEEIAEILESNGYDCFLPHRDQTVDPEELKGVDMSQETKDTIFQTDLDALNKADITVALITGQDIDSGTCSEIGYTYALKKPVLAIDAEERRYRNLFVEGMLTVTINNTDQLLETIDAL
tara:strand:+ start:985 stop:1398 length:414 start_codon:yes stop_codon:yes gene_type:complete